MPGRAPFSCGTIQTYPFDGFQPFVANKNRRESLFFTFGFLLKHLQLVFLVYFVNLLPHTVTLKLLNFHFPSVEQSV